MFRHPEWELVPSEAERLAQTVEAAHRPDRVRVLAGLGDQETMAALIRRGTVPYDPPVATDGIGALNLLLRPGLEGTICGPDDHRLPGPFQETLEVCCSCPGSAGGCGELHSAEILGRLDVGHYDAFLLVRVSLMEFAVVHYNILFDLSQACKVYFFMA